ncbi:uncharacterized proline-rich protein-like [Bacillus rossius redtenbacheri]|uniref:uncharacterized proline-rich protein-like n=1 Tax=Bacillus rossius redtenbacheri TaxID=93214 RepID=UPI002FDCA0CB
MMKEILFCLALVLALHVAAGHVWIGGPPGPPIPYYPPPPPPPIPFYPPPPPPPPPPPGFDPWFRPWRTSRIILVHRPVYY